MKFVCLGYGEEETWNRLPKNEQDSWMEECFVYDDQLLKNRHWVAGGKALQSAQTAKTLRWKNGKVVVTDGPYAETKEVLGGFGVLEARDMAQAVELVSLHPCLRTGPVEIRPLDEEALKRQAAAVGDRHTEQANVTSAEARAVQFACLGYIDEKSGTVMSKDDFAAMIQKCIEFDEGLKKSGHWINGVALQGVGTAKTLRPNSGRVTVTDGPFAETKEQLGGVVVNQFRDMPYAVEVLSTHPALPFGVVIEIRPIDVEMNARWEARQKQFTTG